MFPALFQLTEHVYYGSEDVFFSSLSRHRLLLNQALTVCLFACLFP